MRAFFMWLVLMAIAYAGNLYAGTLTFPDMNVYQWIGVALICFVVLQMAINKRADLNFVGLAFLIMGIGYVASGKAYIFF